MGKKALQEPTFLILTALAAGSQHGYGIMSDVARISQGRRGRAGVCAASTRAAVAAGLSPSDLVGAHATVRQEGKGFGPVVILVAIAVPVAAHIVNKFWDDVIWPHISGSLGADALGEREEE